MAKSWGIPRPSESDIALAKVCGCGKCMYCSRWNTEQLLQKMINEIGQGGAIAEEARRLLIQKWSDKDGN